MDGEPLAENMGQIPAPTRQVRVLGQKTAREPRFASSLAGSTTSLCVAESQENWLPDERHSDQGPVHREPSVHVHVKDARACGVSEQNTMDWVASTSVSDRVGGLRLRCSGRPDAWQGCLCPGSPGSRGEGLLGLSKDADYQGPATVTQSPPRGGSPGA